jgi:hypothetical protein
MSAGVPEATRNAFVYLMENPSECPDSAAAIINKMNMKSAEAGALLNKINEYTKAIRDTKDKLNRLYGAMDELVDLASSAMTAEQISGFAELGRAYIAEQIKKEQGE